MGDFDKVIGYESIKLELCQIVDMMKNPERYTALGAEIPRGILLYGDPGLGKTLMATALMNEAGVQTITVRRTKKDGEIVDDIVAAFNFAKANAPAIILLDDMDKFANEDENHRDAEEYVTIQTCIDEIQGSDVLVVATVNNIRKLPSSLTRAGRFDRKIHMDSPDEDDAVDILKHYLEDKPVSKDIDVLDIYKMVNTSSSAEIKTVLNEAAILAGFEACEKVEERHIVEAALRRHYGGPGEKTINTSGTEVEKVVIHEAAHLVVSESLKQGSIGFASIRQVSGGQCGGTVHSCCPGMRRPHHIMISLAGKIATEMRFGGIADGCGSDLEDAIDAIIEGLRRSATRGFSHVESRYMSNSDNYYLKMESTINAELERYTVEVKDILLKNNKLLERVAEELKNKQYLLFSDIQRIEAECGLVKREVIC